MNNAICDDCQSVRACFHLGCRPVEIETRNGGAVIDTTAPKRLGWLARLRAVAARFVSIA